MYLPCAGFRKVSDIPGLGLEVLTSQFMAVVMCGMRGG